MVKLGLGVPGALYGAADPMPFPLGEVKLLGHNPCQRCVVPARDADSGETIPGFQKRFMQRRSEQLSPWAAKERFNHYYRCAVNTFIEVPERGKVLHVGDGSGGFLKVSLCRAVLAMTHKSEWSEPGAAAAFFNHEFHEFTRIRTSLVELEGVEIYGLPACLRVNS